MSAWDIWMKIVMIVAGVLEILKLRSGIRKTDFGKLEYMTLAIGVFYIILAIYLSTPFSEDYDVITMVLGMSWLTLILARWRYKKKHGIED